MFVGMSLANTDRSTVFHPFMLLHCQLHPEHVDQLIGKELWDNDNSLEAFLANPGDLEIWAVTLAVLQDHFKPFDPCLDNSKYYGTTTKLPLMPAAFENFCEA